MSPVPPGSWSRIDLAVPATVHLDAAEGLPRVVTPPGSDACRRAGSPRPRAGRMDAERASGFRYGQRAFLVPAAPRRRGRRPDRPRGRRLPGPGG
ncbi:hypothetical protein QJS66_04725 [Kocuria rhizophila]|nr:hypothetical protein QJS66_04725 [Kocuria rhizophila]